MALQQLLAYVQQAAARGLRAPCRRHAHAESAARPAGHGRAAGRRRYSDLVHPPVAWSGAAAARRRPLAAIRARGDLLTLGLFLTGGLVLRLISIDSRGLWGDEAVRVWAARLPAPADVARAAWAQPPSAPLYWLALHYWIGWFGHGDIAVRLFSTPAAVGAIAAVYWLGARLAGPPAGLLAAGLLAISPLAVEVAQEATMYAWSALLTTLVLAAALRWLQTGRGARVYVALSVTLLYTHYLGALLLGLLFLTGLIRQRGAAELPTPRRRAWRRAHALIALLWAPWLVLLIVRLAERWGEMAQLRHPAGLDALYGGAILLTMSASAPERWTAIGVAGAVGVGAALVVRGLWTSRSLARRGVWLVAGVAAGLVGTLAGVSALTGDWLLNPRYFALILPAALAVAAAGAPAARLRDLRRGTGMALLALLTAWITVQAAGVLAFYQSPVHGRDGLREMGVWLTSAVRPGDRVVANHPLLLWSLAQYYAGPTQGLPESWDVRDGYPLLPPPQPAWVRDQIAALARLPVSPGRLWLIYLQVVDPDGRLLQQIHRRYREVESRTYPLATVYLFEPAAELRAAGRSGEQLL